MRAAFEEIADPRTAPPGEADERGRASRPSPWLPPRAVVSGDRVVVSDGRRLHVLSLSTQKLLTRAPIPLRADDPSAPNALRGAEARHVWGLIEGFGLTVAGDDVYANVPARDVGQGDPPGAEPSGDDRATPDDPPRGPTDDAVCAVRLEGDGGRVRWTAGGLAGTPGLPERLRLVGTPLLYRGAVHVAGLRPSHTGKETEAWHVALDPATGAVRSTVFLGTGSPLRRGRTDEAMPSGCVGAHGRVHLVTALGIAAAVDARTGRTLWAYRYDRGRPDGADVTRRLTLGAERSPRRTSFANQPPVVVDGRLYLAPTDGRHVLCLSDRPRGPGRVLTRWALHRTEDVRNLAIEHVVGVTEEAGDVPPTLVAVGQGYGLDPLQDPFTCVVAVDVRDARVRWERALPFGGIPEPFGLAALAGDDVFVPTAKGIARYALLDGADRPSIEAPAEDGEGAYGLEEAYGNLVPVAGRGLVAVAPSRVTFYLAPK
ncbi:MAG: PQQ-binding-like beta-propeller repeat protein [Planctomycetota bacterium]